MSDDRRAADWLADQAQMIRGFMDYAPIGRHDAGALARALGQWFNNPRWSDGAHTFADLGYDSRGGQFACWRHGEGPAAVVYFGSEGGRGVLASTVVDWIETLAHGPTIIEYSPEATLYFPGDHRGKARDALARFRRVVERSPWGPLGPEPPRVDPALNAAFCDWVAAQIQSFSIDDMARYGLSGGAGTGALRRHIGGALGWGKLNAKAMLKQMNRSGISRADFEAALADARTASST